jgi:hypothetical protein
MNPNIALVSMFMCAPTDEEARRRADGATFFQFALRYYGASQSRERPAPGTVNMWEEYQAWKRANPDAAEQALMGGLVGSPETLRRKLRKFESSHIDQVIFLNQAGKNTHEHICEALELFAAQVMPVLKADQAARDAKKATELAPFIEAALKRKKRIAPIAPSAIPTVTAYGRNVVQAGQAAEGPTHHVNADIPVMMTDVADDKKKQEAAE